MTREPQSTGDLDGAHDLVELTRFTDSAVASLALAQLESHDIPGRLIGEAFSGWFSGWYGSTIGGVRLHVRREDLPRAQQVLKSVEALDESANLDHSVDYGDPSEESTLEEASHSDTDADSQRAWRASIVGFLLCPPLLNFYSMWILLSNGWFRGSRSLVMRRVRLTLLVNVAAFSFSLPVVLFIMSMAISSLNPQPSSSMYINEQGEIIRVEDGSPVPENAKPLKPVESSRTIQY